MPKCFVEYKVHSSQREKWTTCTVSLGNKGATESKNTLWRTTFFSSRKNIWAHAMLHGNQIFIISQFQVVSTFSYSNISLPTVPISTVVFLLIKGTIAKCKTLITLNQERNWHSDCREQISGTELIVFQILLEMGFKRRKRSEKQI